MWAACFRISDDDFFCEQWRPQNKKGYRDGYREVHEAGNMYACHFPEPMQWWIYH